MAIDSPRIEAAVAELLEKETLDHVQLAELFKKVKKLPERPQWLSSKGRPLSDRPPIKIAAKAPVDPGLVDGGADSEKPSRPARPRPRKNPGIATA